MRDFAELNSPISCHVRRRVEPPKPALLNLVGRVFTRIGANVSRVDFVIVHVVLTCEFFVDLSSVSSPIRNQPRSNGVCADQPSACSMAAMASDIT